MTGAGEAWIALALIQTQIQLHGFQPVMTCSLPGGEGWSKDALTSV